MKKKVWFDEFQVLPIEKIGKGAFVRKVGKKRVFVVGDYERSERKYWLEAWDNISVGILVKKGTLLEVGFDF